jgi:hypothetical protein
MSGSTSNSNFNSSGTDSITLNMAGDSALGEDPRFTVNVDGQQVGGVQSVSASQSSGQTQAFTFQGDWAPGQHNVTVTFANNFIYPGVSGDRNLYVDSLSYDGQTVSNSTTPIYESPFFPPNSPVGNIYGNATFSVNDSTALPAGFSGNPTNTPGAVSIGNGADTLVLNMAEDAYQGDAQFTVSVDGQQIGGVQTTTAIVGEGQTQEFDVKGNFGSGTHNVAVTFLNDQIGDFYPAGTPGLPAEGQWAVDTTDRNLYVMGMSLNGGSAASGAPWELSSAGTQSFSVTSGSGGSASGLFASNGAAANGDNAAITTAALSAGTSSSGSSTGMSFVAPTTDTSSSTTAATDTASTGTGSGSGTTDTSATMPTDSSVTGGSTASTQDFSVPTATSTNTDTTSGSSGSAMWTAQQPAYFNGYQQQG